MLFLLYTFYSLAWNALTFSYPVEVLPYPVRAKGYAVPMLVRKLTNFVSTFIKPVVGLDTLG